MDVYNTKEKMRFYKFEILTKFNPIYNLSF